MSQLILDPHEKHATEMWTPPGPIPPSLRSFGLYPNVDEWLPGDLILVRDSRPSLIGKNISKVQLRGGFAPSDAQWQHAAVYLGESTLVEATRIGVQFGHVYDYVGNCYLRVRRDPLLTQEQRWRIAMNAAFRLRSHYDFGAILSLLRLSFAGFWLPPKSTLKSQRSVVICSQLYADAYMAVTDFVLAPPLVTPAALSSCARLQDVPTRWLKIS